VALTWLRTIDKSPHMFSAKADPNEDWVLYSGGWLIGRVCRAGGAQTGLYLWSLTGPHTPEAPGVKHGTEASIAAAQERLVSSWQAWVAWAELQESSGPSAGGT